MKLQKFFGRDKLKPAKVTPFGWDVDATTQPVVDEDAIPIHHASFIPPTPICSAQLQSRDASRATPRPSDEDHWEVLTPAPGEDAIRVPSSHSHQQQFIAPSPFGITANPISTHGVPRSQKRDDLAARKKSPPLSGAALGILRALDPHQDLPPIQHPPDPSEDHHAYNDHVRIERDKKERKGFWDGVLRDRDGNRWKAEKDKDEDIERLKERVRQDRGEDDHGVGELTRMIGYLTATASEDWSFVLEVCERASASEANAKEAARALRREFKYAEPKAQLAAARLWAIMLRNASEVFIQQISQRKFIEVLEDALASPRTSPVVRERLMEVLAAAAFITSSRSQSLGNGKDGIRALWCRLKPADKPETGVPFDTDDVMFSPPVVPLPRPSSQYSLEAPIFAQSFSRDDLSPTPPPLERPPPQSRRRYQRRVIPLEEDIRRLFQECKIARSNADVLSRTLAFSKPDALDADPIPEFLNKCRSSQELIYTQIPWATVGAERSQAEKVMNQHARMRSVTHGSQQNLILANTEDAPDELTIEEELLVALLDANEALLAALRMYDDLARVATDRATEEKSEDVRMDRRALLRVIPPGFSRLEHLGDTAADAQRHDEAISHYTTALSLNPPFRQGILIKRSKAYLATGSWEQALDDANQVITLDPSSPLGYEMKHAALHKAGEYDNAIDALEMMLSKIAESPNLDVQLQGDQYISPSSTRATIRRIIQRTIRHSPRVLINTTTGRLYDKAERASAFESLPLFNELVSSTTTRIDYVRIKREVQQYFQYVMLSHKWEDDEPLFQQVKRIAVYDLDYSPAHDKLQMFCKLVRDVGFKWAWSDTCCINKSDHFVLQEALVAMFQWYQGSAMTIVFLRGVRSSSQLGALVRSIWNTRAWTLQEYIAAKVVHFYTEDWTLYLDLRLPNHKESQEVMSEMETATGVPAQQLMALRPGLSSIREKLRLASTRHTTLVEDAAYSLLGIFSVAGIPAIYGEGVGSLGRLLAHVLAGSGDVSILAWNGERGSFNSCLPAKINVFNGPATSHLPSPIPDAEMERLVAVSHSSFELEVALRLYDRLNELPAPWFAASRMKLPCIAFSLPRLSPHRTRSGRLYLADTVAFGMVEIKTRQDLSRMESMYLIHPWLDTILERDATQSGAFMADDVAPPPSSNGDNDEISDEEIDEDASLLVPELEPPSYSTPVPAVPVDRETRARRVVARLRQSFGALLVAPVAEGRRAADYRRVAADSSITVRFQENVSLSDILDNVRTLDIL